MPIKKCETCGSEFQARLSKIRTCSTKCRNQLISSEREQRHKATKQCVVCEKEFEVGASDSKRLTCSDECGYKLRGSKTSRSVRLQCATCNKSFLTKLSQLSQPGGGKYCSKECMYQRNSSETNRECVCCGKMFTSPPSQMHVVTCSTECGYEWFSGPRRVNYIGATKRIIRKDGTNGVTFTRWYSAKKNTERRVKTQMATPPWANLDAIRTVYDLAAKMESLTGQRYHVDHIVPLNSRTVSGLHVHHNLQVLPAVDNLRKGNRHWPDMP
jgi:hypothetical protein